MTDDRETNAVDPDSPSPRIRLRFADVALVAAGGVAGTAAREAVTLTLPSVSGLSAGVFLVNLIGAFLLGTLLEALTRRGPDSGPRRRWRLLLGTGLLGGFTTYSAFAVDTALALSDSVIAGVVYSFSTILFGGIATWLGLVIGSRSAPKSGSRA